MSTFSIDFIRDFETIMESNGRPAPVDWVEGGYLFIVPPDQVKGLERNVRKQRDAGCVVDLLTPGELKARFPSMNVDDIGAGAHTPHDGWCDPNGLLWGFRRKAVELGATYIRTGLWVPRLTLRERVLLSWKAATALPPIRSSMRQALGREMSQRNSA